jgi:ribosomal protein S18 acetylase RimI-like enzyme
MSDTGWWIRDAELNDAPELAVLMCELGCQTDRTEMETRLELILLNPAYKTFVAIMDANVCGMIGTLTYPSYEHNDASGRILALVTSSTARRRGIGRALIATAEKDFAQRGIRRVSWIHGLPEKMPTSFISCSVTTETGGDL